jgi:hypothetical protein
LINFGAELPSSFAAMATAAIGFVENFRLLGEGFGLPLNHQTRSQ